MLRAHQRGWIKGGHDFWNSSDARACVEVACRLRLVRALCAETYEPWREDNRYINVDLLKEQKKAAMKTAA